MIRYNCQIKLPNFDLEAQQKLQGAAVLIVGMGGLGCPAAQYLVAMGVGKLGVADFDVVNLTNLHRQILYQPSDIGKLKTAAAFEKLSPQNLDCQIITHNIRVSYHNVINLIMPYDIIIDASDNFDTRYLLNDACVILGKPLVYGAIYQYEGQITIWNAKLADNQYGINYRDIFPDVEPEKIPNCSEGGVIPTIAGIIGIMQANETIKYICNLGDLLVGKMLVFDALTMQSRVFKTKLISQISIKNLIQPIEIEEVSFEQYQNDNEKYTLIDVRTIEEKDCFDIGGEHIPIQEFRAKCNQISLDKPIIIYCESGKRSTIAAQILKEKISHIQVFSLKNGLKGIMNND